MSNLSLAVLTTNHNTWDLAQRCAQACYTHDRGNFDSFLVYDDCSQQEPAGEFLEGTKIYRGRPNVGLTKALNIAFGMISQDVVVLFDSDAYPTTPFCKDIVQMFEKDPSLGLVALRTTGSSGTPTESYTTEPNVWSLLLGQSLYGKTERFLADRSGRLSVFTCAMAVRKSAFDELRGFDENFDWLDLDHDFSMRMNRSRWRVSICPGPVVFHEGGGTPQLTRKRVLRFYKNRWYLLNKFDRIPAKWVVRRLISARLWLEYFLLRFFGRRIFRDQAVLQDKLAGRREILRLWTKP